MNRFFYEAVSAAISDLDRMGYLVSGVCFKNGALEIVCCPPDKAGKDQLSTV
jgi:hypothetical protein